MKLFGSLLFAGATLASVVNAAPVALEHWNWLSPVPTGLPLRLLHFDGKAFLAAGSRAPHEVFDPSFVVPKTDALIRSIDGSHWVVVQAITNGPVTRIQSDDGELLAFTRGEAWRSIDGLQWTVQSLRLPAIDSKDFYRIGRANGRFVAVRRTYAKGDDGRLHHGQFASADGVDWKLTGAPTDGSKELTVTHLEYGNGRWVELLSSGKVFVSTDGENWTSGSAVSPNVINPSMEFLQFESGEFFAGIASGRLARSTDGLNWTEWFTGQFRSLSSVAKGPEGWIIIADGGRTALHTRDFSTGEFIEFQPLRQFSPMLNGATCRYGNGRFVSVSDGSVSISHRRSGQIHTSIDGRTWTQQNPIVTNYTTSGSAHGNGRIVAVGSSAIDGHGNVGISENGVDWRFVDVDVPYPLGGVRFGAGRFVALGYPELNTNPRTVSLLSSTNGVNWLQHLVFTNSGGSMVFGNDQFLVVTRSNLVVSRDGLDWEQRPLPDELIPSSLIFGGDQFVSLILNGWVSRSRDGLTWTRTEIPAAKGRTFFPGTYGQGLFVQSAVDGAVICSPDGENWQVMEKVLPGYGFGITYGRGWFVAASYKMHDSGLYASQDGLHWTRVLESVGEVIQHMHFYEDRFLAFGDGSTVLQSDPLPPLWEPSLRLVGRAPRRFQVSGTPNQRHRVEVSPSLAPPMVWQLQLELTLPASGVVEFELPTPSQGAEFYRVGR